MARHASMSARAHGMGTRVAGDSVNDAVAVAMTLALPFSDC